MPAPLVWGLIVAGGALLGKVVYDVAQDKDDDDDREYREAEARREREHAAERARKAEQARKEEQERLASRRQQRLIDYAKQQLNSLADQYELNQMIYKPLAQQALSNRAGCRAKLLSMYDTNHMNDVESDCDQQDIRKLQQFYAQLES